MNFDLPESCLNEGWIEWNNHSDYVDYCLEKTDDTGYLYRLVATIDLNQFSAYAVISSHLVDKSIEISHELLFGDAIPYDKISSELGDAPELHSLLSCLPSMKEHLRQTIQLLKFMNSESKPENSLTEYQLEYTYIDADGDTGTDHAAFQAEDIDHAVEQLINEIESFDRSVLTAKNITPDSTEKSDQYLIKEGDTDYRVNPLKNDTIWVRVGNVSIAINQTDEGVVTDLYEAGAEDCDSVASTYAFFAECANRD